MEENQQNFLSRIQDAVNSVAANIEGTSRGEQITDKVSSIIDHVWKTSVRGTSFHHQESGGSLFDIEAQEEVSNNHTSFNVTNQRPNVVSGTYHCSECNTGLSNFFKTGVCSACERQYCWMHFGFLRAAINLLRNCCFNRYQLHLCLECHKKISRLRKKHRKSVMVLEGGATGFIKGINSSHHVSTSGRIYVDFDYDLIRFVCHENSAITYEYSLSQLTNGKLSYDDSINEITLRLPTQKDGVKNKMDSTLSSSSYSFEDRCHELYNDHGIKPFYVYDNLEKALVKINKTFPKLAPEQMSYIAHSFTGKDNVYLNDISQLYKNNNAMEENKEILKPIPKQLSILERTSNNHFFDELDETTIKLQFTNNLEGKRWFSSLYYLSSWAKFAP